MSTDTWLAFVFVLGWANGCLAGVSVVLGGQSRQRRKDTQK